MKFNQVKKDRRYRVIDNFTYFYNKLLKNNKTKNWVDIINEPYFLQWKESSFKNICLQNIDRIRKLLGINGIDTTVYYWTDHLDNNIIDIILLHDITKYIDIIEYKYNDSIFEIDKKYYNSLLRKINAFDASTNSKFNIRLVCITSFGIEKNM